MFVCFLRAYRLGFVFTTLSPTFRALAPPRFTFLRQLQDFVFSRPPCILADPARAAYCTGLFRCKIAVFPPRGCLPLALDRDPSSERACVRVLTLSAVSLVLIRSCTAGELVGWFSGWAW
jgi:hypothetical protein